MFSLQKNMVIDLNMEFSRGEIEMANEYFKKYSVLS